MKAYGFMGTDGRCALLARDDPKQLPDEFEPWKAVGEMEIKPGDPDRLGLPTDVTLANLQEHGCHFFQLTMTWE